MRGAVIPERQSIDLMYVCMYNNNNSRQWKCYLKALTICAYKATQFSAGGTEVPDGINDNRHVVWHVVVLNKNDRYACQTAAQLAETAIIDPTANTYAIYSSIITSSRRRRQAEGTASLLQGVCVLL